MAGLARAFLAVVPPPPVLDAIETLLDRPRSSRFKWTRREQWHVTLQFYGRVRDAAELVRALEAAVAARRPVPMQLRGGGAFPTAARARVFWLGVDDGDALAHLHDAVVGATGRFVGRRDREPFHPHLTLARVTSATDLVADVDALAGVPVGQPWTATDLVLMESETRRGGAVHTEVARVELGG